MKFTDADEAILVFKKAAIIHGECTENGNYKLGNESYDKIVKAVEYLKRENKIDYLYPFLEDGNIWS